MKERGYFDGIEDNLKMLPYHYPDWTIRVYLDLNKAGHHVKGDNLTSLKKPIPLPIEIVVYI